MTGATQFFDGLRERNIIAHGVLDNLHQTRERKFKGNRGELRRIFFRGGVGRRDCAAGNGDAQPFAERGIIAEFGGVGMAGALDVREPMARFGMDVDFVSRMAFNLAGKNAENEVAVGGLDVQDVLLFAGQIPVRVKPVRIARGKK